MAIEARMLQIERLQKGCLTWGVAVPDYVKRESLSPSGGASANRAQPFLTEAA